MPCNDCSVSNYKMDGTTFYCVLMNASLQLNNNNVDRVHNNKFI